ncbi:hypothetical protein SAPIO_CDS0316 [Scedosporium apiospermum]|uniref:Hydrophobin n=1 Tax=Pseudallescheria apiosperma TaxID=563466 RepID=A0A084GGR7_PSEDA|nr:uncharacterized protein SAPIO_CDS0316 [Scedosporium apiospermum]KEZ46529.1 hypothetical protein SAPIO_CDS0316 [Scedosporium apiospermum]
MQFSQIISTLAIAALAVAAPGKGTSKDITIEEAQNVCGNDLTLSCCNNEQAFGGLGLLSGLVSGLGIFNGCSSLSASGLIGVGDILNSHCKQNVVCCHGGETNQAGLVNVALPCVALGSLL